MNKPDTSIIDQPWSENELGYVDECPYCASKDRTLAYKDVQDWSFYCASGKWTYWDCCSCEALYLSPRPTEASIGKAYNSYYTHNLNAHSIKQKIKMQLRNECFSHWLNINITPRLYLPKLLGFLLAPFRYMINVPFELASLVVLPKGKLLDIGCGSGNMLKLAKQLGWDVTGLEIDPNAVKAAREQGLNVIEGGYHNLQQFSASFDCVICSHVLEHVHQPLALLDLLVKVLKPQGVLLLSLPNAKSHVRSKFGGSWRGLEAPRHLAIPALQQLIFLLQTKGFSQIQQLDVYGATLLESNRIAQRECSVGIKDFIRFKLKQTVAKKTLNLQSDFIQITARKAT